jgi:hypothetical protein
MGTIHKQKIVSTKSGRDSGELVVDSIWTTGKGQDILQQKTRYIFSRQKDERIIDQVTTLHALDRVVFNDDKEGLLGMRVARGLESPDEKGGTFTYRILLLPRAPQPGEMNHDADAFASEYR